MPFKPASKGLAAAIVNFLARESSNEVTPFAGVVLLVTTFDAVPPSPLGDTTLLLFSSCKLTVTWSQTGRDSSVQQNKLRDTSQANPKQESWFKN